MSEAASLASERRRRWRWPGRLGLAITLGIAVVVLLAPWIAPYDPAGQSLARALEPPRAGHVFGTDELGRDILSRVLHGGRISLLIGLGSVAAGLLIGGCGGLLAGYRGGWIDALVMRAADVLLVFSGFVMAVWALAILGQGVASVIVALVARAVPVFARVARNTTVSLREHAYVEAALALGGREARILFRHVLPNLLSPLLVVAALRTGSAILLGASLSFLGLGVPPDVPEWGVMVKNGMSYLRMGATHLVLFPGLAIVATVLGLNLLGDELRDAWDPRQRS